MRCFDAEQMERVRRLLLMAEDLCGDYFHLGAFDLQQAPYDVRTARALLGDGVRPPPSPTQLAELRRCDLTRIERSARDHRRVHYRICLWDPHILNYCEAHSDLHAVLLYVLTHELVHVVRFSRRHARFQGDAGHRQREESEVHHLTHRLLAKRREPGLQDLLHRLPHLGHCLVDDAHCEPNLATDPGAFDDPP